MKKDIILSGVGGQGILSIATVIGKAALKEGLYMKQAEVHGMSQRGGDVQSNLRISDQPIASDLIPSGKCDLIISLEPYVSLTTNYTEQGEHSSEDVSYIFQTTLQQGKKTDFSFPDSAEEAVCYDGFFENKAIYKSLGLSEEECCVDINGTKGNRQKSLCNLI